MKLSPLLLCWALGLAGCVGSPAGITPRDTLTVHQVRTAHQPICFSGELQQDGQGQCLGLDASRLTVRELRAVSVEEVGGGGFVVQLRLTDGDARAFGDLTRDVAVEQPPRNRLAIVLGGNELVTAPTVAEAITGGVVQISGNWTKAEADALAQRLGG